MQNTIYCRIQSVVKYFYIFALIFNTLCRFIKGGMTKLIFNYCRLDDRFFVIRIMNMIHEHDRDVTGRTGS